MSNIIQQAAKRLEELRNAGIDLPWTSSGTAANGEPPALPDIPASAGAVTAPVLTAVPRELHRPAPVREAVPLDLNAGEQKSEKVTIDLERLAGMGYIVPSATRSLLVDEFRVVKRPIINNAIGASSATVKRGNLVMVTSAIPGEGKTFTAINLAMSIAMERDSTVLLVDADPARPAALARLGLPERDGLLDRLIDPKRDLSEFLLKANVERLWILPVGTPHDLATELLASETMDALLEEMAMRYKDRIIVFDAPPLLPSPESHVLASRMGQVVFVVESGRTPQAAVKQALTAIEKCPIVLPMLNKCRGVPVQGYGYGYGYGYSTNRP